MIEKMTKYSFVLLDAAYKVTRIQPVDMFPHTQHVENVVLLCRR